MEHRDIFLLLLICGVTVNSNVRDKMWLSDTNFDNKIVNSGVLGNISAESSIVCASICYANIECESYFYNNETKRCVMSVEQYTDTYATIMAQNFVYYKPEYVPPPPPTCDIPGYIFDVTTNLCFKIYSVPMSNPDAEAACQAEGARLIHIDTMAKQERIKEGLILLNDGFSKYAIGGNDVVTEGTFRFNDGQPMTYFNWMPYEPHSCCSASQDCIVMMSPNYEWDDNQCGDTSAAYICEKDMSY